jgi:hypothetical protein
LSDAPITPEQLRLLCEQAGLTKALTMFPDGVKAAVERGMRPLGDHPGITPVSSPAPIFDPSSFERDK